MLDRILPLATYYTAIAEFIESRSHTDYGLVNHALCAAIRDMLKVRRLVPLPYTLLTDNPPNLGLPNPRLPTRARIRLLLHFHPPKALVLHPSHTTHPLHPVHAHERTRPRGEPPAGRGR